MADLGQVMTMPRGIYDPIMQYQTLDLVEYNGSSYVAKQATMGNEPSDNSVYWQLMSKGLLKQAFKKEVTLTPANWKGSATPYSYTISLAEATIDNIIEVQPNGVLTDEVYNAMINADIEEGIQAVGSITLYARGVKPTIDLPILIIIRGD